MGLYQMYCIAHEALSFDPGVQWARKAQAGRQLAELRQALLPALQRGAQIYHEMQEANVLAGRTPGR